MSADPSPADRHGPASRPSETSNTGRRVAILMLVIFLDLLGFGVVIPLLPDYARSFGATATAIGALVAGYALMQFLFGPLLGALSDRIGRRPVLLATIAVNAVGFLLFGLAGSLAILFAARLISGVAAANLSVAQAYLADVTPPEKQAQVFGLIGAAFGMGFVFGPPLGALVAAQLGLSAFGFVVAGLYAANFLLALVALPESRDAAADTPADAVSEIAARPVRRLFAVMFLFTMGYAIMPVVGALLWADRFGLSAVQIGYVFTMIGVATAAVQAVIGPLARVFSERAVLLFGLALVGAGIGALPLVPTILFTVLQLPLLVAYAIGHAFVFPTLTALVTADTPRGREGAVLGRLQATAALALVVGPLLAGWLYDRGIAWPFAMTACVMTLAILVAASHPRRRASTAAGATI